MNPTVRIASDDDGPEIGRLAYEQGFAVEGIDFSHVHPYWLVAEIEGKIVGALQLCTGLPIGWLEMLFLDPKLSKPDRIRTFKALVERGLFALEAFGSQVAMWSVPHELGTYKKILKKRGAITLTSGSLMAKML
jgi:hypothetical protein